MGRDAGDCRRDDDAERGEEDNCNPDLLQDLEA
jgi:hypothetical protein